ncbi:MAG: CHC2 zinc finger domain-containing protein [Bacteroidota bacterium]|nr:CHC2 zinc finger domain-containing protein [Bacteroidota bacterium]
MIPETTIDKIKAVATITQFIKDTAQAYGKNKLYATCPACQYRNDKKKQGLTIDTVKQQAKCFNCGVGYGGAIDFIMKTEKLDYPAALRYIAKDCNIFIEETADQIPAKKPKKAKTATLPKIEKLPVVPGAAEVIPVTKPAGTSQKTFCDTQLADSGLTYDNIRIETVDETGTIRFISPFVQGTRDQYQNIIEHKGDDVLIRYYDLEAKPVMYKPEKANVMRPLVRLRWQNPAAHTDKDGNPIKYQSPAGSGSHVYIPEMLRRMYKHARKIKRLYIQEGEKKAEKSCKHGMLSVGIMGINNLGTNGRLPDEIQLIVQRCEVEEVIFVLDSDWQNLSETLKNGQAVDTRPRQFFPAVRNFKEYLRTLSNLGSPVEIYFGYIKTNEATAKGIDDLLCMVLPERETELPADFDFAVNDKNGTGTFVQVNKITMLPDDRIADFWLLNDAEKFAEHHKARLKELKEFKIKGFLRKFSEQGKLEMCQQLFKEEQF